MHDHIEGMYKRWSYSFLWYSKNRHIYIIGEVVTPKPVPEPDKYPNMVEEKPLPGKKAYIPPYTPKSALRNSSSFQRSRGLPNSLHMSQKNGGAMGNRNFNSSQRSGSNSRSSSSSSNHMNQFGKTKRSRDSEDDEGFSSDAVLPKRETSKRAAKEKSSQKRVLQEKVNIY